MKLDTVVAAGDHAERSWLTRYAFAVVLTTFGLLVTLALTPDDTQLYAALVGVAAVTAWFGGLGPATVALALGWTFQLLELVFVSDEFHGIDITRWLATLGIGLAVVLASEALRRGRERASTAASTAEASLRDMARLQELSATLLDAVTPSDVAHALVERVPALVGARGASFGLIDGSDLVIVDPRIPGSTHQPGFRLPLQARAPITRAASRGTIVHVENRETFERDFPDGAALTLYAQGAIAVPAIVAGEVVGALSLLFDEPASAHQEAGAIAALAGALGGQALERARLYEGEREARRGLDRILQVSPRFHTDSVESAAAAICSEAAATFGADTAILWRLRGRTLELVCTAPPGILDPGLEADLEDFPTLLDAVDELQVSFVPDVQQEARRKGLERVRRLGLRSSFRVPIAVGGGTADLVLVVSWTKVISEPDPSTVALLRRFADQAGFALEQVERRLAQAEAASRRRRRAGSRRSRPTCRSHRRRSRSRTPASSLALEAVGAEAGSSCSCNPMRSSSTRLEPRLLRRRARVVGPFELDADVPFAGRSQEVSPSGRSRGATWPNFWGSTTRFPIGDGWRCPCGHRPGSAVRCISRSAMNES